MGRAVSRESSGERSRAHGAAPSMSAGRGDVLRGGPAAAAAAAASAAASAVAAAKDERRGDAEEDERQNDAHRPHGCCSSLQNALGSGHRGDGGRAQGRRGTRTEETGDAHRGDGGRGRGRGAWKAGKRRRTRARESSVARRRLGPRRGRRGRPARRATREIRPKQRGAGGPRRTSASSFPSAPRNRQRTQLLEKSCFALIYVRFPSGSPRGPAEGLNVCWYGNTAVADKGFPEVFPARARHSGGVMVLARPKCAIFGQLPCF